QNLHGDNSEQRPDNGHLKRETRRPLRPKSGATVNHRHALTNELTKHPKKSVSDPSGEAPATPTPALTTNAAHPKDTRPLANLGTGTSIVTRPANTTLTPRPLDTRDQRRARRGLGKC